MSGVHNLLQNEDIPYDAAQDALGFLTQDGKEVLVGGRINIGDEGTIGIIRGLHFGYTNQGVLVMYRSTETTIDVLINSVWTTIISGLTSGQERHFANYASLSGSWTFINCTDGFWKINNQLPQNPISLYNPSTNFHGNILIDKGRMLLWARQDAATATAEATTDLTGLYGSKIDPQDDSVYPVSLNETVGVGDGTTKTFTGTLGAKVNNGRVNVFGVQVNAPTGNSANITNIQPNFATNPTLLTVTAASHGLTTGDGVLIEGLADVTLTGTVSNGGYGATVSGSETAFTTQLQIGSLVEVLSYSFSNPIRGRSSGIVGGIGSDTAFSWNGLNFIDAGSGTLTAANMTQLNGIPVKVTVIDANTFTIATSQYPIGTIFTPYSSGGTVTKTELLQDNQEGVLSSLAGSTGTINYSTGAYSFNLINAPANTIPILATYQSEDSTNGGIADFTSSSVRAAGDGFVERQDVGGDPIQKVLVGQDGSYYSMKQHSVYQLTISADDLSLSNIIYYQNMGLASPNSAVSTRQGIIFLNVANPLKPEMTLLQKNLVSQEVVPIILFSGFKFSNYNYSDSYMDTWERYIVLSCMQSTSQVNDRILLMNQGDRSEDEDNSQSVNISPYNARMFVKDSNDQLYVGSPLTLSVYNIYNGFDDMGQSVQSYWISNGSKYGNLNTRSLKWRFIQEELKRGRRLRVRGSISPNQQIQVYLQPDDANFQLMGVILGNGSYVDNNDQQIIGQNFIGTNIIGGGGGSPDVFSYFIELKFPPGKYRKRAIKFVPVGIGYFDFAFMSDWDIELFESRIPSRFRQKQNVSLTGVVNQDKNNY